MDTAHIHTDLQKYATIFTNYSSLSNYFLCVKMMFFCAKKYEYNLTLGGNVTCGNGFWEDLNNLLRKLPSRNHVMSKNCDLLQYSCVFKKLS